MICVVSYIFPHLSLSGHGHYFHILSESVTYLAYYLLRRDGSCDHDYVQFNYELFPFHRLLTNSNSFLVPAYGRRIDPN